MPGAARILFTRGSRVLAARTFHSSALRMSDPVPPPLPARKPMGAFRGGLFSFLFGCVLSGGTIYSYLVQEYRASNDLLTEDIYTLQASVTRLTNYVKTLEEKTQGRK